VVETGPVFIDRITHRSSASPWRFGEASDDPDAVFAAPVELARGAQELRDARGEGEPLSLSGGVGQGLPSHLTSSACSRKQVEVGRRPGHVEVDDPAWPSGANCAGFGASGLRTLEAAGIRGGVLGSSDARANGAEPTWLCWKNAGGSCAGRVEVGGPWDRLALVESANHLGRGEALPSRALRQMFFAVRGSQEPRPPRKVHPRRRSRSPNASSHLVKI